MRVLIPYIVLFFSLLQGTYAQTKENTATKNVFLLSKEFKVPYLDKVSHKVWVYLPPNYEESTNNYPVLYMHDGQNLFNKAEAYGEEWGVDETLNKLYKKTGKGYIVVGINNAGEERINEYTPWKKNNTYDIPNIPEGGSGKSYINFIVEVVKPYIDTHYRTKKEQKDTALIGSSMGGLISYYGGLELSNVFGKIGVLSPSFWFSDEVLRFTKKKGKLKNVKMYLLIGEKEPEFMVTDTRKINSLLLATGFTPQNLIMKINPEGDHSETFWGKEFLHVVKWLYN